MSNLALFGYICNPELVDSEVARLQAMFPSLSPSPLPKSNAQEAHPSNQGGGDSIPFVSQNTGD